MLKRFTVATIAVLVAGNLLAQTPAKVPTQNAQPPSRAPSQTDTEINLLKIEMQRLRADVETMKGHIGRIVQYIQQRDAQGAAQP